MFRELQSGNLEPKCSGFEPRKNVFYFYEMQLLYRMLFEKVTHEALLAHSIFELDPVRIDGLPGLGHSSVLPQPESSSLSVVGQRLWRNQISLQRRRWFCRHQRVSLAHHPLQSLSADDHQWRLQTRRSYLRLLWPGSGIEGLTSRTRYGGLPLQSCCPLGD